MDWWLLICFNILVLTLGFHTYLAYIVNMSKEESSSNIVKPMFGNIEERTPESVILMKRAVWLNKMAKAVFIIFMVLFNIIFWIIALNEHFTSADEIISPHLYA